MSFGSGESNMYGLPPNQFFEIQAAFHQFDLNHNGYITGDEMRIALQRAQVGVSDSEVQRVLSQMDFNHDGQVSYDEYMRFMAAIYRGQKY